MNKNALYALVGFAVILVIGAVLARPTPSSPVAAPSSDTVMVASSTPPTPASTTTSATATSTTVIPPTAASTTVSSTPPVITPPPATAPPVAAANSYTMVQLAVHNTGADCWTAVQGNVYDVTSWINRHPGGSDAILSLCGKDGSAAFKDQHGGERRPERELASFKIGTLIK